MHAVCLRSNCRSRGGRSSECNPSGYRATGSQVCRSSRTHGDRRLLCRVPKRHRGGQEQSGRIRFQQLMNTRVIDRPVRGACRGIFQGVYSIDTLPETPRRLVCNTDPSYKPGQHWVALYVDSRRRGEYFDWFGRKPPATIKDNMNDHCVDWLFNAKQLQSVVSN
jgi:hypothetical protein